MNKTLMGALAAAALTLCTAAAHAERTLVLSTYGFNNAIFKKHVYDPFETQCGCKVVLETGNASARLSKLEARKDNPNVDLVQITDFLAGEASAKGLLQPIDFSKIKNLDEVHAFGRDPLGNKEAIAYTLYSVGLVVRTDKPSAKVTSWKDLWSPELKGHLMLANITGNQGLAQLFMVDRVFGGNTPDKAAGFARLAEIKGHTITYYTQSAQMTAMVAQDEAWVAPVGRFSWLNLKKTGKPLAWVVPKEGQVGMMNTMSIIKGSKNVDLAHQLIDFWLSAPVQKALADELADSPINRSVVPKPEVQDDLTWGKAQIDSLVFMNTPEVLRERGNWVKAWNQMVAK